MAAKVHGGDATAREHVAPTQTRGKLRHVILAIAMGTFVLAVVGALLVYHADHKVNHVALGAAPRPVSVVEATPASYRDSRSYVGAVESWVEASIGPQYISAYVKTVVVRPGDAVKEGQLLATLDCSNPTAASRATEMQAQGISERQRATAHEAARQAAMLDGGFIAPNDVELKTAQSSAERAQLLETRARLTAATLDVHDCALRAPFDGEIAARTTDPGAFIRPGTTIVSVVDRTTVRVVVDAPEKDFEAAQVDTPVNVHMLSTGAEAAAVVSRRAPKADPTTRTVHIEIDIADPRRQFPTGTTALVRLDVGKPVAATVIPLSAATQQEGKAKFFVVDKGVAHLRDLPVVGERGGGLYFDPNVLPPGTQVVSEGRALLSDGDPVNAKVVPSEPTATDAGAGTGPDAGSPQ
ncbi:MAG: rane fusion protein multidrug efflux system [Myxococcales bacterium]|nr:rane fusion protein multidrug efflux system [Myxococcales bacterium]